jgi:Mn-dependent DtxR family transcriptional regulator
MIENTQRITLRAYEGKAMILSNFSGKRVTTGEIAQFLNISKIAAWKQLSKLKKEGLVKDFKSENNKLNRNIWLINNDKNNFGNLW